MRNAASEQSSPTTPAPALAQGQDAGPAAARAALDAMQQRAMKLELRLADLTAKESQLREQRNNSNASDRARIDQQLQTVRHDIAAGSIEFRGLREKIEQSKQEIETRTKEQIDARALVFEPAAPHTVATTLPPDSFLSPTQVVELATGGMLLTLPLILALARRLWVRGPRVVHAPDLESSPRLQRMEQAIESIAVEVERIGEAQRFATKLLTERQAPAPISAAPFAGTTDSEP